MIYKLVVTARAQQDRDRAFTWYAEHYSEAYADRWYEGLAMAIESLRLNPKRCPLAHESHQVRVDLHEELFGPKRNKHRILLEIVEDSVFVVHIRHSAQRDLTDEDLL